MKTTLTTTFGFEPTGLIPQYAQNRNGDPTNTSYMLTGAISTLVGHDLGKRQGKYRVADNFRDCHCVELPSPVCRSVKQAKKYYSDVLWAFRKHGLTTHNPITVCGGNHFHFGLKNAQQFRNIARDIAFRPYISWIFMEPDDTDSANNFCIYNDIHVLFNNSSKSYVDPIASSVHDILSCDENINQEKGEGFKYFHLSPHNKCMVVCTNNNNKTCEFRCIGAPWDSHEFDLQLDFFIRYFNTFKDRYKSPLTRLPWNFKTLQVLTPQWAISEFHELCKKLKLNPRKYETLINRNLFPRWKNRRKRH